MNVREEILKQHSKEQCAKIVSWVGQSQQRFDELFYLFLNDEYRVVQRAAWPVSYCVIAHPAFINHHFKSFTDNLKKANLHNAVKRNSMRLLQNIPIPKKYQGALMNICFDYVADVKEAVAVKAFALTVLGNLAKDHSDIIPEIKLLIEEQLPRQTAAFKSRAKRLLKQFGD